ncbi:E3 ubiquitin-protein ligase atl4 [Thalictrum thalictroides]|uniref:RING-type E3 ubiquitin transferase n=1 Tax=Thalictrum thalictroides TaxID=46969 RepID=A0A7J6XCD0_THATH|nr:E3 ubiquitin-protein ligase atl4 [Thalictrum thalictroides]
MATNEPVHVHHISSRRRVVPEEDHRSLIDSLPLFSFNSISKLRSSSPSGDCAVCLSKFEPDDQLRLLPLCCHAFHSSCIDTWLASNHTCPLCRSTVHVDESDGYLKLISSSSRGSESFRVEIGNVSSRRIESDSGNDRRRSYSIGSFEYIVEDETSEIAIEPIHRRGDSESTFGGKKDEIPSPAAGMNPRTPGSEIAAEVASGGRGWLKDYIDRLASSSSASSISSRALSFRFSERFFTGSSRRSESFTGSSRRSNNSAVGAIVNGGNWDLEGNRYGEEIGSFLRWLSGVY